LVKVQLNTEKTKTMWFNCRGMKDDIMIDGRLIEVVNSIKYLGVWLDERLKFSIHADYVVKKMAKKVGVLARMHDCMTKRGKIVLYNSIVLPHITYCATVLNYCNEEYLNKLQILQNRAMRVILGSDRYTRVNDMLNELKWLNVREQVDLYSLCFIYKLDHGLLPAYLNKYLIRNEDVHGYNTRIKGDIRVVMKGDLKGVLTRGVSLYNSLPEDVRNAGTLDGFRRRISAHILDRSK
jgi:hypothetical protein